VPRTHDHEKSLGSLREKQHGGILGLAALIPRQAAHADWADSRSEWHGNKTSEGVDLATGKFFQGESPKVSRSSTPDHPGQADDRAKSQIIQYHRKKAEGAVNQLQNCQTTL